MSEKYIKYINYIIDNIELPYFKNMDDIYGASENEFELILSKVFNQPVSVRGTTVYDENDRRIYYEYANGHWEKFKYDQNSNIIYFENSDGFWEKHEYDEQSNETYVEYSDGSWRRMEYDDNGNQVYYENDAGYWVKKEYDSYGDVIYYETSDEGVITDIR